MAVTSMINPRVNKKVVLLFSADPAISPYTVPHPTPPPLAFHLRPTSESQVSQNFALWRAVQASALHTVDIPLLAEDPALPSKPLHIPILMLRIPRPLHAWLAKLNWGEVVHAMLCELHRAALNGWSVRYLPLSLRRELRSMTKRERYWDGDNAEEDGESEFGYSSGSEQEGDPFDTPDSRELRQLELRLSTDEKGSIPVGKAWSSVPTAVSIRLAGRIKGQNLLDAVVHAGWGLWVMFVDVAMRRSCARISEYADHFSHLIATRKFELLWAQINALYQMGSVRKRCRCPVGVDQHGQAFSEQSLDDGHCHWEEKGLAHLLDKEKAVKKGRLRFASIRSSPRIKKIRKRKGRGTASGTEDGKRRETYFAYLPEEVLTEHIIPMLCLEGKQRQRRLEHDI